MNDPQDFERRLTKVEVQLSDPEVGMLRTVRELAIEVRAHANEDREAHKELNEKIDALIGDKINGRVKIFKVDVSKGTLLAIGGLLLAAGATFFGKSI